MKDKYIVSSKSNNLTDEIKVIQSTVTKFIAPSGIVATLDLFNIGNQFITIQIKDERFNSCKITINKDEWDKVVKSISNEDQMLVGGNTSSTGEESKSIANHSDTRNSIAIKSIEDIKNQIAKEYWKDFKDLRGEDPWIAILNSATNKTITRYCYQIAELYAEQFKTN